tara:strand:- start:837 stop:1169 length:333 start_codon:yes stop_codon:yes gene_type:complete
MPNEKNQNYGRANKRIIFTDTDHRHAQLILRLKHDNMTQADFFRLMISGYLSGEPGLQAFVDEHKDMSKTRKSVSRKLIDKGVKASKQLGFSDDEVTNIFDLIAEEHPEL